MTEADRQELQYLIIISMVKLFELQLSLQKMGRENHGEGKGQNQNKPVASNPSATN